tara:strand:+ start:314 stop:1804 length:1491 start_codon:yes stop_codon:yes gene_type:complete
LKWLGKHIIGSTAYFRKDVYIDDSLRMYNDVIDGNPVFTIGSGDSDRLMVQAVYGAGTKKLSYMNIKTYTTDSISNAGQFKFSVDEANILQIKDTGLALQSGKGLYIGTDAIITDNPGGTATLSNIDDLDATTIATFNAHLTAGDITGVHITTDSGGESKAEDTNGSADFSILGDEGVGVTNSGTTITVTAVPSEIDHNELGNYSEAQHFEQGSITTVGTIGTGLWQGTPITKAYINADQGNITTVGTIGTGVWNADVIASAKMATASDSAQGAVELATTGEADTGTDTARAVTPAGLKSHVDSRYSYAYMAWSASGVSSVNGSDPEWVFPHIAKGIYEEDWNKDENITATSVGATTFTITKNSATNGLVIPHAGQCVGFHAHGRNDDSDATFKAGLFHLEGSTTGTTNNGGVDYGNTGSTHEATLRWLATADEAESSGGADGTSSHSFKGPCKLVSNTDALTVSAGDVLLPAIMGPDNSDEIFVTMTIILKIPLA